MGRILLHWCDSCHIPVLSERCSCGSQAREVPITPPGDARPAFPSDIALINAVYLEHFGAPLVPPGHLCLLNKVPDRDRMEEIIIGGGIAGSLRYIPGERRYEPIPRPEAGVLIRPRKRFVVVDDGAVTPIREQGAGVLAPGLVAIDDAVNAGDEVLIYAKDGTCIGAGRAKAAAAAARAMNHGSIVRTRKNVSSTIIPGLASWERAVAGNREILARAEAAAIGFVQEVCRANAIQPTISYSGGKDSLATLLVVTKAIGKVPLLFADTGMEFPETYDNIRTVQQQFGLDVVTTGGPDRFWEQFEELGPPAVNARWCCRACKLGPVLALIRSQWGQCLSFIGQRKYESARRAQSRRVWRNPNVPAQICAAPIHNWTALHVWLYLMQERAPYNTLYERGLDRIGCFMCPASDMALIHRIESAYPALWQGWMQQVSRWQDTHAMGKDWAVSGGWRIRQGQDHEDSSNC